MLTLYQIYFDESSYKNCNTKDFKLYYNETLDVTFENACIVDIADRLMHKTKYAYTGIFSHAFLSKPGKGYARHFSKNACEEELNGYECLSFFKNKKKQKIFHNDTARYYNSLFDELCEQLGINYHSRITPRCIIMQNAFVLRNDLYIDYVNGYLKPAIHLLTNGKTELSKKALQLAPYKSNKKILCTYVPFLLEKLISAYLHINRDIKCNHYSL